MTDTGIAIGVGIGPFDGAAAAGPLTALDWYVVAKERGKNMVPTSNDFEDAGWVKSSATVSGDEITLSGIWGAVYEYETTIISGDTYSCSVDLKSGTLTKASVKLDLGSGASDSGPIEFDLSAVTAAAGGRIEDVGGGWYRCHVEGITANATTVVFAIYPGVAGTDTSGTINIARGQLEVGAASTSYEATTGTATYNALLDQRSGGRHMFMPGGSANPLVLSHTAGADYFYLPGTNDNGLTSTVTLASGSWEVEFDGALIDWGQSGADQYIFSDTDWGYARVDDATAAVIVQVAGATDSGAHFLALPSFADGERGRLRILYDHSAETITLDESDDGGESWSEVDSEAAAHGASTVAGGTVGFGCTENLTGVMQGDGFRWIVRDGIDGTVELDIQASDADPDASTFTEASSNAATVTINRSTTGYKTEVIDQTVIALATDDYLQATYDALWEFADGEDYWAMILLRGYNSVGSGMSCMEAGDNTNRWQMNFPNPDPTGTQAYLRISNSTYAGGVPSGYSPNVLIANGLKRTASSGNQNFNVQAGVYTEGTISATHGALTHGGPLNVGVRSGSYGNFVMVGAAIKKGGNPTDAEALEIVAALIAANAS